MANNVIFYADGKVSEGRYRSTGIPVSPVAYDDFETGDLTGPTGMSYGVPLNCSVSNTVKNAGTYSARYVFDDGKYAQLNFVLPSAYSELWLEFYIYYPDGTEGSAAYAHDASGNNKFLRLRQGLNNLMGSSTNRGTGNNSDLTPEAAIGGGGMGIYSMTEMAEFVDVATDLGQFRRIRCHAKLATGPSDDNGILQFWVGDSLEIDESGLDVYDATGFDQGYLQGTANSNFSAETFIFIDDFKIYSSDPGW